VPVSNLGRYRLVERVATGGMGEVYRGVEIGWGGVDRPVAVKVIAPELARHPDFITTFIDEARLSYRLVHANIVTVRDFGQVEDTWFIAMEWVDGADLGSILRKSLAVSRQPIPLRLAVLIAAEAARGLDYAHRLRDAGQQLHIVHRDVSPANLLVSLEGEVKVSDFGIARWRLRQAVSIPGALKGKLGYMAPEQARGEEVDARADVYSLGVVLYEMVTGKNPFVGGRDVEILDRLRRGHYAPPSQVGSLPGGLEAIILRAMAPDREARYATAAAMREDLEAFARREAWSLSPAQLGQFVDGTLRSDDTPFADTARGPAIAKAKTPPAAGAAPKPFDAALGAQLAALSSSEREPEEAPAGATLPGKRTQLATITPAPEAPPPGRAPSTTDLTDLIPKRSRTLPFAIGGLLLAAALGVGAALLVRRDPQPPVTVPSTTPKPEEPAPEPAPPAAPMPTTDKLRDPPRSARVTPPAAAKRSQLARLSIECDVPANVYVDERFVGEAPLGELAITAGRHTVRAEGLTSLRLPPKEETVTLKDGEARHMRLELK
jgi:serine/threonine-protein kinase